MAVILQDCLDKIGYSGTPAVNLIELNDLYGKFIRSIPISSVHVDGVTTFTEYDTKERCINNGKGGTCLALAISFKFMLDAAGFSCDFVSIKEGSGWDKSIGVIVEINSILYFCGFGYYAIGVNKPIKVEDGFTSGNLEVTYNGSEYCLKNNTNESMVCFLTYPRALSYFQLSVDDLSIAGKFVDNDVLMIATDQGGFRYFQNGTIIDNGETYQYDDQVHSLLDLFKFNGTV